MGELDAGRKSNSLKHVLIVDDDERFRGALGTTLRQEGFQVTEAEHAKVAQEIIGIDSIDIVVSDINMPGISGIEFMHYVKRTKPNIPVILMTGFAELKETQEAYELGARGFLPKPFQKEELLKVLQEWLYPKSEQLPEEEDQDLNFCKLSIDDFVSGKEITFDVFIRLSEQKYVKIAHKGEDIPIERINSYKSKNIRDLYMRKDDFRKYLDFNLKLLPLVNAKSTISKEKKRSFLKHTSDVILEHLHLNGIDAESFQDAKTVVESSVSLLTEPDDMMNLLTMLNSHTDFLYAHSLGVSMYSVMIARKVHWNSPANVHKVAMGGLLHDIGKKEIDREILIKRRLDMTPEEVKLYESHSYRGADLLKEISSVPTDILQITLQHHENCMGLGFPLGLSKSHTHPMARLVAVANEFCSLVILNPNGEVMAPQDAIQRMMSIHSGKLDPTFFIALMELFNVTPSEAYLNRKWDGSTR